MIDYAKANREYRLQRTALTRAVNSGDPAKVVAAVEKALREWEGQPWPDEWSRWRNALDDAWSKFQRSDAYYDGGYDIEILVARFRVCLDRFDW